jgi:hypothetical protein
VNKIQAIEEMERGAFSVQGMHPINTKRARLDVVGQGGCRRWRFCEALAGTAMPNTGEPTASCGATRAAMTNCKSAASDD